MKRAATSRDCVNCKCDEAILEDTVNGLWFCSNNCQAIYHRYDRDAARKSYWGEQRRRFFIRHLIGSTDIVIKYMLLCETTMVGDIVRHIVNTHLVPPCIMATYLHPTIFGRIAHANGRIFYMASRNGLMSRIGLHAIERRVFHDAMGTFSFYSTKYNLVCVDHLEPGVSPSDRRRCCDWTDFNGGPSANLQVEYDINVPMYRTEFLIESQMRMMAYQYHCDASMVTNRTKVDNPYAITRCGDFYMIIDMDGRLWVSNYFCSNFRMGRIESKNDLFVHIETTMPCIAVACEDDACMYITIDGSLWLADMCYFNFRKVPSLPPVYAISSSVGHTMVIDINGRVWARGVNIAGALGLGLACSKVDNFTMVTDLANVVSIYCSTSCSFVVCDDDSRWAAGSNHGGQLGLGNITQHLYRFSRIPHLPDLTPISPAKKHCS